MLQCTVHMKNKPQHHLNTNQCLLPGASMKVETEMKLKVIGLPDRV